MLVLASASPRRRDLLAQLGLPFVVHAVDVDEEHIGGPDPVERVRRLALEKARACQAELPGAHLVLGADTAVVIDGEMLGKPRGADDAVRMLERLSGREHTVLSGLAVLGSGRERSLVEATHVWMRRLDESAISAYVASGEPLDKAGGYAIQGLGAALVTRIEGCFYNVVGLPLARLVDVLADFGLRVPG